jgi:hypothetical protein
LPAVRFWAPVRRDVAAGFTVAFTAALPRFDADARFGADACFAARPLFPVGDPLAAV